MTIRLRNRVNFFFFIIALVILAVNTAVFLYNFIAGNIAVPSDVISKSSFPLLRYDFWSVIASVLAINIYVVAVSFILLRTFEKTQATEVFFFLVFLTSLLFDTSRIFVPVRGISESFSYTLIHIGNLTLAARLLAPISLFALTAFCEEEFRQQTEQNCIICILVAVFFAVFLPVNTAIIGPNLCISYGFGKMVHGFSMVLYIASVMTLFIRNKKDSFSQINTAGFLMIIIGYNILFSASSIAGLASGVMILSAGTVIYLVKLHQHYLWID